jgi:hypothetical protein
MLRTRCSISLVANAGTCRIPVRHADTGRIRLMVISMTGCRMGFHMEFFIVAMYSSNVATFVGMWLWIFMSVPCLL